MSQLYPLFEHSVGYTLFLVTEYEEVSFLTEAVSESLKDLNKLRSMVQLVAFMPFKTSRDALANMNSISEGILHEDLQLFLETNLPTKKKKKQAVVLGVSDPKLALAITEVLGFQCQSSGVILEVLRNIRDNFHHLVNGVSKDTSVKAQLALALNYSRAKVKFNINRVDNMIIQSIALLDQLDKDLNTFTMRIREWYSYHFPELIKIVPDNALYARVVSAIKDRNNMVDDIAEKLEEIIMDSDKVNVILDAAKTSMGMDISEVDLINIELFCTRVVSLTSYRQHLMEYLKEKMHHIAPNLASLIGETVGARLISHAGSLTNLAKYPASTVQILGAEKALFRALKTRSNTPKYGLIFHSTFIGRAAKQNKGRISRYLASKCSIASRIDCFSEIQTDVFGKRLKQQVEDRLKFYDTGDLPAKNIDVMSEAAEESAKIEEKLLRKIRKREMKQKRKEQEELEKSVVELEQFSILDQSKNMSVVTVPDDSMVENNIDTPSPKKKKKKKKDANISGLISENNIELPQELTPEENFAKSPQIAENHVEEQEMPSSKKKKKKKKKDADNSGLISEARFDLSQEVTAEENSAEYLQYAENHVQEEHEIPSPSKKKKKKRHHSETYDVNQSEGVDAQYVAEFEQGNSSVLADPDEISDVGPKLKKKKQKNQE